MIAAGDAAVPCSTPTTTGIDVVIGPSCQPHLGQTQGTEDHAHRGYDEGTTHQENHHTELVIIVGRHL